MTATDSNKQVTSRRFISIARVSGKGDLAVARPRRLISHLPRSILSQQWHDVRLQFAAGDVDIVGGVHKNIGLAPHAEFGQVNARLNGKAGPREDAALFASLEAVHIGPIAVRLLSDAVAGAVHEI